MADWVLFERFFRAYLALHRGELLLAGEEPEEGIIYQVRPRVNPIGQATE